MNRRTKVGCIDHEKLSSIVPPKVTLPQKQVVRRLLITDGVWTLPGLRLIQSRGILQYRMFNS